MTGDETARMLAQQAVDRVKELSDRFGDHLRECGERQRMIIAALVALIVGMLGALIMLGVQLTGA